MSDLNLTINEDSDIYLAITETPAVVSISSPLIASANVSVTVGTSVTVANFPAVTTVAGTVTASLSTNDYSEIENIRIGTDSIDAKLTSVAVGSLPAISGTVTANIGPNTAELRNEFGYYPVEIANTSTTVPVSGTVTANLSDPTTSLISNQVEDALFGNDQLVNNLNQYLTLQNNVPISGTVTASVADLISQGTDGEGGPYRKGVQLIGLNWDNDGSRPVQTDNVGQLRVVAGSDSQNFPISGTVTANIERLIAGAENFISIAGESSGGAGVMVGFRNSAGETSIVGVTEESGAGPLPISGTVTANGGVQIGTTGNSHGFIALGIDDVETAGPLLLDGEGRLLVKAEATTVTIGNSVTIASLPAISGTVTVGNVEGWGIPLHDYRSFSYSGGNLSTIAYKTGGASGTTVGILTLAYDGSGNLTSMTKS